MIPAVAQTLADILAGGTSLISTEQIDFNHPGVRQAVKPGLSLYCYDLQQSSQVPHSHQLVPQTSKESVTQISGNWATCWFDVSFLISAWDHTALGEQRLLSEVAVLLHRHRFLREELLAPALRGYGDLTMTLADRELINVSALWSALGVPLRPALYVVIKTPFEYQEVLPSNLDRECFLYLQRELPHRSGADDNCRVVVAGLVKSAATTLPLAATEVAILGTTKVTTSNREGVFVFDDLPFGNYLLELRCPGYVSQQCNVLVSTQSCAFKEILLNPIC